MTFDDYALTLTLLGTAAFALWIASWVPRLPPEPEEGDCSPLVPLGHKPTHWPSTAPLGYSLTTFDPVEPEPSDLETLRLMLIRAARDPSRVTVTWLCRTAGCHRVHRTRQGAEFCSMMESLSYTRPSD